MFFKYDWQLIYGKKLSFHKHFFYVYATQVECLWRSIVISNDLTVLMCTLSVTYQATHSIWYRAH